MKRGLITFLLAGFFLLGSKNGFAKCNLQNALGEWQLKYRLSSSQIGLCSYELNGDLGIAGSCQTLPDGASVNFFDGGFKINPSCQLTTWVILDDGTLNSASGKLRPDIGLSSGKITSRGPNGYSVGTFTMRKQ
jgi:hypothetical protein